MSDAPPRPPAYEAFGLRITGAVIRSRDVEEVTLRHDESDLTLVLRHQSGRWDAIAPRGAVVAERLLDRARLLARDYARRVGGGRAMLSPEAQQRPRAAP